MTKNVVQKTDLPKPISVMKSDPLGAGTVIGLSEGQTFFIQGEDGINLGPEKTWCAIPKNITTECHNQIRNSVSLGILAIDIKPLPSSVKYISSIKPDVHLNEFIHTLKQIVYMYEKTEDSSAKKVLLGKLNEFEKLFSKDRSHNSRERLTLVQATKDRIDRISVVTSQGDKPRGF